MKLGRLIYIRDKDVDWGWGVCVNHQKKKNPEADKNSVSIKTEPQYILDILLRCQPTEAGLVCFNSLIHTFILCLTTV